MQCASVYLSKLLFYMQCTSVNCCVTCSVCPLPLPGPADLFQNAQHPWSSAHLPSRVELHLCSASPPQWTPCVWWVGVSGVLAWVLQSGDVYSHDLPPLFVPCSFSLLLPFSSPLPPPPILFPPPSSSGSREYVLLPCHSQIPREDQRKVFAPVPEGVTKVGMCGLVCYVGMREGKGWTV